MKLKRILAVLLLAAILCLNLTSCSTVIIKLIEEQSSLNGGEAAEGGSEANIEALVNEITEKKIRAVVTVVATFQKGSFFSQSTQSTQSSGVIVSYKGRRLILTNNHAVNYGNGYSLSSLKIVDCEGTEYAAQIYNGLGEPSCAPEYDLACLYSQSIGADHEAFTLADKNPYKNEKVISLSTPSGQANAISFGKVLAYEKPNLVDADAAISNVTENVIWHSAKIRQGSSGGALVNYDLELVGIHFAGTKTANNGFADGCAIPVEMVIEFLDNYT